MAKLYLSLLALSCSWQVSAVEADVSTTISGWQLYGGQPVHQQLARWAAAEKWTLHWRPTVSWLVLADAEFHGSFEEAVSEVIESLYLEGKGVRLVLWEGNRVAEVLGHDAP